MLSARALGVRVARVMAPSLAPPSLARRFSASPVVAQAAADGDAPEGKSVGKVVLAKRLAAEQELSQKKAAEIIDALLDDIMLTVAEGQDVVIPGFGAFKKRHRPARKGRNPSSGEELAIAAKDAPAFSAGSVFKGVVQAGSWEGYDKLVAQQKAERAAKKPKK